MKRLGITQRVDIITAYQERRDCLDQRWTSLALALDFLPIPLPNAHPELASRLIEELRLDAILLSGGNTVAELTPNAADAAPERDQFEHALIDAAISQSLPILGVCRGMQLINLHFGGRLSPVDGHVACRHTLRVEPDFAGMIAPDGNSYHNWAIAGNQLGAILQPMARDREDHIEAFKHPHQRIAGIMWHPEREQPPRTMDIDLMKRLLQ
jgi:putative glutamine amidotransferase